MSFVNLEKYIEKTAQKKAREEEERKRRARKADAEKKRRKRKRMKEEMMKSEEYLAAKEAHRRDVHNENKRRYRRKKAAERKKKERRMKYNARRREERRLRHEAVGDVPGVYMIITARDCKRLERLAMAKWLVSAYGRYNAFIEQNRDEVVCEKLYTKVGETRNVRTVHEILLLKRINPSLDSGERTLRDEDGRFETAVIENNRNYAIIAKDKWMVPESFHVYGYDPRKDRKTGRWILENIVMKDCGRDRAKNIFVSKNRLVVQYDDDIDLVICKNDADAERLYEALRARVPASEKSVFFTGMIAPGREAWLTEVIEEKTGWSHEAAKRKARFGAIVR